MDRNKILVVDDDKDMLRLLARKLGAAGFNVVFAQDGAQATRLARLEEPDLVLLDLGLPAGDGMTLLARLRNHAPTSTIPVVVVSGRGAEAGEQALAAGADAYFDKPPDPVQLEGTIRRLLAV